MAQYSFVNPQFRVEPVKKSLNDGRTHLFLSTNDGGACGYWRSRFVSYELEIRHQNAAFVEGRAYISDPALLQRADSYRVSRLGNVNEIQWLEYIRRTSKGRMKIIYDIDDILCREDMPEYNLFRNCFPSGGELISECMKRCDVITVTQQTLRDYYAEKFNIPVEKFKVIPNRPAHFWLDHYHPVLIQKRVERHRGQKLRIGIAANMSHYSAENRCPDDLSCIESWVISNRKKYKFVFKCALPGSMEKYRDDFEFSEYSSFLDYPREKREMDVDLLIQPLQDNLFNRCKSAIKFYEAWGDGTPCFISNLPNYSVEAPEFVFDSIDELENKISELFTSEQHYLEVCDSLYHKLDDLWVDKNLQPWLEVMM